MSPQRTGVSPAFATRLVFFIAGFVTAA